MEEASLAPGTQESTLPGTSSVTQILGCLVTLGCDNGFEAFIVGGCVRDSLMGTIPNDWDITTNAKPEDTKKLFKKTVFLVKNLFLNEI